MGQKKKRRKRMLKCSECGTSFMSTQRNTLTEWYQCRRCEVLHDRDTLAVQEKMEHSIGAAVRRTVQGEDGTWHNIDKI